eukprot:363785-Chlamydomonas_euryale.AAC.10
MPRCSDASRVAEFGTRGADPAGQHAGAGSGSTGVLHWREGFQSGAGVGSFKAAAAQHRQGAWTRQPLLPHPQPQPQSQPHPHSSNPDVCEAYTLPAPTKGGGLAMPGRPAWPHMNTNVPLD